MSNPPVLGRMDFNSGSEAECTSFRMFLLDEAARAREAGGDDIIRLTLGKSDLPLNNRIVDAIASAVRDPSRSNLVFPEGLPELRHALANHYTALVGTPISHERILVDAGTSAIYPSLFRLLTRPGAEIVIPLPYYPLYRVSAILAGARVKHYRIDMETMRVDLDSLAANVSSETVAVVLNSPGNPLGNVITPVELEQILHLLPEHVCIVFDEIYENAFLSDGSPLCPLLLSRCEGERNLVVTNSCSKAYRMYTKRVGWSVLPSALVEGMSVILHHTRLTVDPAVQYGAVEALLHPEEVRFLSDVHRDRWDYAWANLQRLDGVRLLPSEGGFYCVLDCRDLIKDVRLKDDLELALDVLQTAGVATVPGEDFGLPGTLRLSFTASRFEEAVDRLAEYFRR